MIIKLGHWLKKTWVGLICIVMGAGMVFSPMAALAGSFPGSVEVSQANQVAAFPATVGDRVRQDLSQRTGVPANQLRIVETTQKTWSDGCLGLARPDEMCSMAMVQGWRVKVTNGKRQWVYRTDRTGQVLRLDSSGK